MQSVTLRTARLTLRCPAETDIDAITAACQDPDVPRWTTVPSPYSRESAASFVNIVRAQWEAGTSATWAICEGDELQGVIALDGITAHDAGGSASIGYWMAPWGRGKGFLVEAGRAVVECGFADLGLARISWGAVAGNIPSARSARALGFRYEGRSRLGVTTPLGREDLWFGGIISTDDRAPVTWEILG